MAKLVIISHTPHYLDQGRFVGWGPTLRELDHLATLFDTVTHIAPLHDSPAPESSQPYQARNVELIPVSPAGGPHLQDKLGILWQLPTYVAAALAEIRTADAVHVRAPANIALSTLVLLAFIKQPSIRWFKYAGNWRPKIRDALSYRFQRWWLCRDFSRGQVTINGIWSDQPAHVHSFLNPCLTHEEWLEGKKRALTKQLRQPLRLLFVGRVDSSKGVDKTLYILDRLKKQGIEAYLDIIGDGIEHQQFVDLARTLGIQDHVKFNGWLSRGALNGYYEKAHFVLLPSTSEGWPKVLSEGMAYGAIPLAGDVSSIPHYLDRFQVGHAHSAADWPVYVNTLLWYLDHPQIWRQEVENAIQAAVHFTYEVYLESVADLLKLTRITTT